MKTKNKTILTLAALLVALRISRTCWEMFSVALDVWVARDFTSWATTAKPLPISPARAASMGKEIGRAHV